MFRGDPVYDEDFARGKKELYSLREHLAKADIKTLSPSDQKIAFMVIPGFQATDKLNNDMRRYLEKRGYQTFPSGLDHPIDFTDVSLDTLEKNVQAIKAQLPKGGKLFLIGHSAGASLACGLSRKFSDIVEGVFCLGGVFNKDPDDNYPSPLIPKIIEHSFSNTESDENRPYRAMNDHSPYLVPTFSYYSRTDYLATPVMAMSVRDGVENIEAIKINSGEEVGPSHMAMINNIAILDDICYRANQIVATP